jgi:23S rRNA (adenine-N6)-dimethyltransferase
VSGRRAQARGRHLLRSRAFAAEIVRAAGVRDGELVLDLGAGTGVLTAALRDAGARVLAVELDPVLAAQLRARFGAASVVEGDAATLQLPRERFAVVANLPFASGTAILRHLLDDPRVPLSRLDAIVEWGLAVKRTRVWPSTVLSCYWGAWYELTLVRRISRDAFAPPPSTDAALLRAMRRTHPLIPTAEARAYRALLHDAFQFDAPLRRVLPYGAVHDVCAEHGLARDARARDLDARQWAALYRRLSPWTSATSSFGIAPTRASSSSGARRRRRSSATRPR